MNCESLPLFKQPLGYNQTVFTTIEIIMKRKNVLENLPALLTILLISMSKLEAIFLALCNSLCIAFVPHWDL